MSIANSSGSNDLLLDVRMLLQDLESESLVN